MNKKLYSKVLDDVAKDQIPAPLDLAPTILAHIQKGKGSRMQLKTKLISAVLVAAISFVVLFYTVPGASAALARWFGYVPGIGMVREGQIRVLVEPVSVTREGITVTVDQVVLNQERTALVYSVESIPSSAVVASPEEGVCSYRVSLELPDGSSLLASPNGLDSWASGYRHRFNYPPLAADVNDANLIVSCLYQTRAGSAPADWKIPLHFAPAPPEATVFPVIEIPSPTAPAVETAAPAAQNTAEPTAAAAIEMSLTLDRAVQMDDGYLLYATVHWKDTPFLSVDIFETEKTLHLLDGNGQEMLYELHYDEQTGILWDQRQTVFAIKTAPVLSPGALTLVLDSVLVELPVEASFAFDPGPNPTPEQQWTPDLEVAVGDQSLIVRSVTVHESGYEFEMTSDSGILGASCTDQDHTIISGSNGAGDVFGCGFNYADWRPSGPVTVSIGAIGVRHEQQMQVEWTPPSISASPPPALPQGCLTASVWNASLNQQTALPERPHGKLLIYGPANKDWSGGEWQLVLFSLDSGERQVIDGAREGTVSPDRTKLAYSAAGKGISIYDLASGQVTPLPGTGDGDTTPMWSLDGKQIVFFRGNGIYDLFITNLDGSGLRQLTNGGVQEWPVGWLPDGQNLLYSVPEEENRTTVYQLNLESGESQPFAHENILAISADGKQMMTAENNFGGVFGVSISDLDGSNRRLINDASLWVLTPTWSPDGQWLAAGVSDTGPSSHIGALINLNTCQVIPLPDLQGSFLAWVP